jgi:uroporphyrinogen-III synthase
MRLIVTRPAEDAAPLAAKLEVLGHRVTSLPLLKIVARPNTELPAGPYQAVCATSANSLRCLKSIDAIGDVPVFTVGSQSLLAAKQAGFAKASAHGGDVRGLADHITAKLKPADGPILYLSGAEVSGDLRAWLKDAGFSVTKIVLYDAVPQQPQNLGALLHAHDGVLLYSPRTAKILAAAIAGQGAGGQAERLTYFCLSHNVVAALPESWQKRVASLPEEDAMLALLD